MALDKLVDSTQLDGALGFTADAIREKTGEVGDLTWDMDTGFSVQIGDIVTLDEGTADADATAADIRYGKSAYVNGVKVDGSYIPPSGTLTIDTTDDVGTIDVTDYANVNITGINIPKPQSGVNSFSIKLPNGSGNDTITFTFNVDSNGNVGVTES